MSEFYEGYWRSNEIAHFGIKGQRWGIRNYQNEDGSYTAAGKERYGRGGGNPREGIGTVVAVAAVASVSASHKLNKTRKEVEASKLNKKDKTRLSERQINDLSRYRKKERKEILDTMKKHPSMRYEDARDPIDKRKLKRSLIGVAAMMAAPVAIALSFKAANKVGNSAKYMEFMHWVKRKKVHGIELKSSEYSIFDSDKLPSGRG